MAIQYDPELKAYYQAKRAEGKHHCTALGVVCNKLTSRIFIILKEQRPYIIRERKLVNPIRRLKFNP